MIIPILIGIIVLQTVLFSYVQFYLPWKQKQKTQRKNALGKALGIYWGPKAINTMLKKVSLRIFRNEKIKELQQIIDFRYIGWTNSYCPYCSKSDFISQIISNANKEIFNRANFFQKKLFFNFYKIDLHKNLKIPNKIAPCLDGCACGFCHDTYILRSHPDESLDAVIENVGPSYINTPNGFNSGVVIVPSEETNPPHRDSLEELLNQQQARLKELQQIQKILNAYEEAKEKDEQVKPSDETKPPPRR